MTHLPPAARQPIRLHGGGPAFGLPEVSPYTMKTEVQLQLAGLPYIHVRAQPADSPKGQLPFIIDGDVPDGRVTVADSTFIRSYIEQKYGLDLDACLSPEQRAVAWAVERMAENQLGWVMNYFRYADDASFEKGPARWFDAMPEPQRSELRRALREKVMANLFSVGITRHSHDEILLLGPAPYHDMYAAADMLPPRRSEAERDDPHPVVAAFMQHEESVNFSLDEVRETVIPTYMGLVKQLDDHLGRLFAFLDSAGRMDDTLIVLTSDHGDYLGDHWLGEKELFHEESVRIPMILYHPGREADATRGSVDSALVEAIDLAPTFLEAAGGVAQPHRLEGRSLLPRLTGTPTPDWRDAVFSECDYAFRPARRTLGLPPDRARAWMLRDDRWKYIAYDGFRPQLFDLQEDPHEYVDLGLSPAHAEIRTRLEARLFEWLRHRRIR